jgi:hypothetical protein
MVTKLEPGTERGSRRSRNNNLYYRGICEGVQAQKEIKVHSEETATLKLNEYLCGIECYLHGSLHNQPTMMEFVQNTVIQSGVINLPDLRLKPGSGHYQSVTCGTDNRILLFHKIPPTRLTGHPRARQTATLIRILDSHRGLPRGAGSVR